MRALRFALRSLSKSPGFVAVAVLCLGLGLGTTTAIVAMLDAVVNPYVPYREPERLFRVLMRGDDAFRRPRPIEQFLALRDGGRFFDGITAATYGTAVVEAPRLAENVGVSSVSLNFFTVLGVRPHLGRFFADAPTRAGDNEAVIGLALWKRLFAGRRSLENAVITVAGRHYDIVGVAARGLGDPFGAQVWLPLPPAALEAGTGLAWVLPIVRLKPDATLESARAEMAVLGARLASEYGTGRWPFAYELFPLRFDPLRLRDFHAAMAGAALAVLLIACTNVGNLMLARGMSRRRDLAILMALGASRGAVVRQTLVEALVIALVGGLLGALLCVWGADVLNNQVPAEVRWVGILKPQLSWRVFGFGLLAATLSALVFGLVPALRSSNVDVSEPLKDSGGTTTERARGRYSGLVIAEVALSLVLLVGAGLLARAVQRIQDYDFGYEQRGLLLGWPITSDTTLGRPQGRARMLAGLLPRLREDRRVLAATTLSWNAPGGAGVISELGPDGERILNLRAYLAVRPDFLRAVGVRVVEGRDFEEGDRTGNGAVIVDEQAARILWPGGSPVGQMLKLGQAFSDRPWVRVIGVARRVSLFFQEDPYLPPEPLVYHLPPQDSARWSRLVIRVRGDEAAAMLHLRDVIREAVPNSRPMLRLWRSSFESYLRARRFIAGLFGAFGLCGLALAAVGLYGVLSYAVSRRMREFGVRIALGADRAALLRLVMHDGFVMVLAGTGIGAVVAMWAGKLLGAWLYSVEPTDPVALVSAEGLLVLASFAACLAPALRATRADPLEILRAT